MTNDCFYTYLCQYKNKVSFLFLLLIVEIVYDLDDGFLCFFINFLHLFAEMIFQVDCILFGVYVYFSIFVECIKGEFVHFILDLLLYFWWISWDRDDLAFGFEGLWCGKVILELYLFEFLWFYASVWVEVSGELQLLMHLALLYILIWLIYVYFWIVIDGIECLEMSGTKLFDFLVVFLLFVFWRDFIK